MAEDAVSSNDRIGICIFSQWNRIDHGSKATASAVARADRENRPEHFRRIFEDHWDDCEDRHAGHAGGYSTTITSNPAKSAIEVTVSGHPGRVVKRHRLACAAFHHGPEPRNSTRGAGDTTAVVTSAPEPSEARISLRGKFGYALLGDILLDSRKCKQRRLQQLRSESLVKIYTRSAGPP